MDTEKLIERLRETWPKHEAFGPVTTAQRGIIHNAADALEASTRRERETREALGEAVRCLTWIANLGYGGAPDIAMRKAARDALEHITTLSQERL